ncbi:MAG: Penicillin-binding protein, 1A family, partial [Parcubacteria group bacterium GW2011_GWD2_42_14]
MDIIETQKNGLSTKIYDKTGEVLLYDMHQDVRRTVVPLDQISDYVKKATISIEDSGFYSHHGIEPLAIVRAVFINLKDGNLLGGQGGSTITQQVVKNTLLVNEKKLSRKLKEWVLAIKLERDLSKDAILELYLNEIPYGGTKYGIEEASQGFFGKSAKDLNLVESAYLAALPQAPSYYSPYGNHREDLNARKNQVLKRMFELGHITEEEYTKAKDEVVEFRPFTSASIKAPHFVFYVIDHLTELYGEENLAQANLKVITTLDWELQKEAERIVYERAHENSEKFNATNASLMAIDPKTGGILVMVGSRDYFDDEIDGNFNIGLAERQPGSSFKPFAYAAALRKGYTTETVLYDVRTQFSTACEKTDFSSNEGCYSPGNYDNKFRGPMTFREALAQSVNVPAVKVLYLAGMKETIELARSLGITTLKDWQRYGLTLVLGGGEVSLLEMTSAYGVFANEGYRIPHTSIKEIFSGSEQELFSVETKGEQVLETEVARSINDMLKDNNARTSAFGSDSFLHFPDREVAVKTGTTNDYRDAWIIGYTPQISVGAWAGNNNNTAMEKKVAGFIVAPMWNEFMQAYFKKYPEALSFTPPAPIDSNLKPVLRGIKAQYNSPAEPSSAILGVENDTTPTAHSILHWVDKDNPLGPYPSNPTQDPQYRYWEYGVMLWQVTQGSSSPPLLDTSTQNSTEKTKVTIETPENRDTFNKDGSIKVRFDVDNEDILTKIEYLVDDIRVGSLSSYKNSFEFTPDEYDIKK